MKIIKTASFEKSALIDNNYEKLKIVKAYAEAGLRMSEELGNIECSVIFRHILDELK